MEESWEDLLRRVYYAGYDDRQRERDYDPMDHKIVDTARVRADLLEQRVRELESMLCRVSVAGPTSRLPTALLTDIKEALESQR